MLLRNLVIGVIMVSLIIASASYIVQDLGNSYDINMEHDKFNQTYNKITEIRDQTAEMEGKIEDSDVSTLEAAAFFISGAWNVLTLTLQSVPILTGDLLLSFSEDYGLPLWFSSTIATALLAMVIFLIVSIIFRRKV